MKNSDLHIYSKGESQFEVLEPNTLAFATTKCGDYVVVVLNPKMLGMNVQSTYEETAKEVSKKYGKILEEKIRKEEE